MSFQNTSSSHFGRLLDPSGDHVGCVWESSEGLWRATNVDFELMSAFSQWSSCILWYILMRFCFTPSLKDVLERLTVLSDGRWAPPEEEKWAFCIGHHSNYSFPSFYFFRLSWRVLGRPWNGRGAVFGCLGAILGRIGAGLGKRSGEVSAYVDLFPVNVLHCVIHFHVFLFHAFFQRCVRTVYGTFR